MTAHNNIHIICLPPQNVSKHQFAGLFASLTKEAFLREHAVAGFRKTGLFPLNREAVFDHGKIQASTIFMLPVPVAPATSLVAYVGRMIMMMMRRRRRRRRTTTTIMKTLKLPCLFA